MAEPPDLARAPRSFISRLMEARPFWSALRMMGVMSPSGMETATLMSTSSYRTIASSVKLALSCGTRRRAAAVALMTRSLTLSL